MAASLDRFLSHSPVIPRNAALGRIFNVTRQTWRLSDDPQKVRPSTEVLLTRSTASDAADLARETAAAFRRHGFHKPSGAWWAADDERFHRFVIAAQGRRQGAALLVATGVAGLAVAALVRRRSKRADRAAPP
jgi:hypothetical protein